MKVVAWGPNGLDGTHIHKPGCRDTQRGEYLGFWVDEPWELEVDSLKRLVEYFYGPEAGSFYEENGFEADDPEAWRHFRNEFRIFPCVELPEDEEEARARSVVVKGDGDGRAATGRHGPRAPEPPPGPPGGGS